ncbi:hypothetical protein FKM82_029580 [Ascaphus truei]
MVFSSHVLYASIVISMCSVSWSTVDYQMSLRKSLPGKKGISVGFPMITYVLYKLFTLTSWILSIVFLLVCSAYIFTALLTLLGIVGLGWAWKQQTEFCKTKGMEILYRMVVGIILVFTFFNVKGQRTKLHISVYYFVRVFATTGILTLCFYLKPSLTHTLFFAVLSFLVVIALGLGIISLILYYGVFHPTLHCKDQNLQHAVDGPPCEKMSRMKHFIIL